MKGLIIIDSLINVIMAIQIRRSLYPNSMIDIAVSSKPAELAKMYCESKLDAIFDKCYLINDGAVDSFVKKIIVLTCPQNAVKLYYSEIPDNDYTDLFFWNPMNSVYCTMLYLQSNHDVRLHVYADAFGGGYTHDSPDDPWDDNYPVFKNGLWDWFFKHRYRTKPVRDLSFDYYLFRPELSMVNRTHKIQEVPILDRKDLGLINCIYGYDKAKDERKAKWIFIANYPGEMHDESEDECILSKLLEFIPPRELIIKPHPRSNVNNYKRYEGIVLKYAIPFEVYALNDIVSSSVTISTESSAVFYTALVLKKRLTVIFLRSLFSGKKVFTDEQWSICVTRMRDEGSICYEPSSVEELVCVISALKDK